VCVCVCACEEEAKEKGVVENKVFKL